MTIKAQLPPLSERQFQGTVIDLARRLGYDVAHHHDSRRQVRPGVLVGDRDAAGFPDLTIAGHGRIVLAELKSSTGRLSPAQKRWRASLEAIEASTGGAVVYRLWRPADWPLIESELRAWAREAA